MSIDQFDFRQIRKIYKLIAWKLVEIYVYFLPSAYKMKTDDRRILEKFIFQNLCFDDNVQTILFVGCSKVTSWYPIIFNFFGKEFITIDPDVGAALYGSKKEHYIEKFENVVCNKKFKGRFDVLIVNGVFGYGINTSDSKVLSFKKIYAFLRKGGRVIIGYSDFIKHPQFDLKIVDNKLFQKYCIPGLKLDYHLTTHHNRHAYRCFIKL